MAANPDHVPLDEQPQNGGGGMFDHDIAGYDAVFGGGHNQMYSQSWNIDPSLHLPQSTTASSLPQSWHNAAAHSSIASQSPSYDSPNTLYGRSFSNGSYHESPYANHAAFQQYRQSPIDPSLPSTSATSTPTYRNGMSNYSAPASQTIAPAALQTSSSFPTSNGYGAGNSVNNSSENGRASVPASRQPLVQSAPAIPAATEPVKFPIPNGKISGRFSVVSYDELCKITKSQRLHNFVNISDAPQDLNIKQSVIPSYNPRKSRSDLKKIAGGDKKLLAEIGKKPLKKAGISGPKAARLTSGSPSVRSPASTRDFSDSSGSGSDESDYESSDDELDIVETSPLPKTRSNEPLEAVRYDTVKAVWAPKRARMGADAIRQGLADFWDVVKTIRDRWKMDVEAVKKALESNKDGELPLLKSRVKSQRDMMEMAFKAAVEHGHPGLLRLFGENKALISMSKQFLADRAGDKDADGSFSKGILELLSRCETLTSETIKQVGMTNTLERLSKRPDEKTRSLAKQIITNGTMASRKASSSKDGKLGAKDDSPRTEPVKKTGDAVAGVKRTHSGDGSDQPAKRVSSGAGALNASTSAAARTPGNPPKRPASSTDKPQPSTAVKPKHVLAKPVSFFAGLQSASKKAKPATSSGATAAGQSKPTTGTETNKKAAAPAAPPVKKPAFSFAETMAQLRKPKEPEPSAKTEEKRPPETPEERAKRLRKEERRKLRVTFKPDATLAEVRIFVHDAEEELGHDANQVRDVADLRSEGQMFKQHKDMVDVDDDEDERIEAFLVPFKEPSEVDYSVLPPLQRKQNYKRYGGALEPSSPEKVAREKYEADTLMVFYTDPSDIPACPREPMDTSHDESSNITQFGQPSDLTLNRAAAFQPVQYQHPPAPATTPDWAAFLSQLPGSQAPAQQPPQQANRYQQLESVFANFAVPAQQQSGPPTLMPQPPMMAPMQQQQLQPQPPPSTTDISAILAALGSQQAPAVPAPVSAPPPASNGNALGGTDLNAILAQFSQGQNAQPQNPIVPPNAFQFPQLGQTGGQAAAPYENPDRKRLRENDDSRDDHGQGQGQGRNKKQQKNFNKHGGQNSVSQSFHRGRGKRNKKKRNRQ